MLRRARSLHARLQALYPHETKDRLFARIACGDVRVDGAVERNPKTPVDSSALIEMITTRRYVSRGGHKLAAVLHLFPRLAGGAFLDAGCATGGFTDCLLHHGAASVFAVDVGYNLLAYPLRTDPRVTVNERTNILAVRRAALPHNLDAAVCDLSFRSLRGVADHLLTLAPLLVALVKPQFEWRSPRPDFTGVVEDAADRRRVVTDLAVALAADGVYVRDAAMSPIAGRRGNREYFIACRTRPGDRSPEEVITALLDTEG